jgi:hypothetical protein
MTFFDHLHLENFERLYGLAEGDVALVRKQLKDAGMTDEEIDVAIEKLRVVSEGRSYGHAHTTTAAGIIEQAFFRDFPRATSLTLRITREESGYEWDGHLDIAVVEVEREERREGDA